MYRRRERRWLEGKGEKRGNKAHRRQSPHTDPAPAPDRPMMAGREEKSRKAAHGCARAVVAGSFAAAAPSSGLVATQESRHTPQRAQQQELTARRTTHTPTTLTALSPTAIKQLSESRFAPAPPEATAAPPEPARPARERARALGGGSALGRCCVVAAHNRTRWLSTSVGWVGSG